MRKWEKKKKMIKMTDRKGKMWVWKQQRKEEGEKQG